MPVTGSLTSVSAGTLLRESPRADRLNFDPVHGE
jgi:hypothetical protein